ncbi:MAG: signal peptidase II [Woeseiaceae bacterium]
MTEETEKKPSGNGSFYLWLTLSGMVIALDQVTKLAIIKWVPLYDTIPLNSFVNITHQRNTGAAFSLLADAPSWQRWFFITLAIVVSVYLVSWLWRIRSSRHTILSAGLALVLGGAIGNVIDRIYLGSVVDFIQVLIMGWPFPSFNVADSAISVGAAFLIIDTLFFSGSEKTDESDRD